LPQHDLETRASRFPLIFYPPVRCLHVAADVQQWPTGGCTQEVNEKLLLATHTFVAAAFPKPSSWESLVNLGSKSSTSAEIASCPPRRHNGIKRVGHTLSPFLIDSSV
jgi:hypothetical protein